MEAVISSEDFLRFREYFYLKTGIMFAENKRYFVDKRLRERMNVCGLPNFHDFFNLVRFQASGVELQLLINVMTVNETYFYREDYQFRCLVESMLPEVVRMRRPGDAVRIWTIPCSTGEEAYSIVLYMLEFWPQVDDFSVEIVASDIDTRVLEQARNGIYGQRALQHVPKSTIKRYFTPAGGDDYQVVPEIRDSIMFTQVNVTDASSTRPYSDFDVVFCRNLLIYFDDASRREAASAIYDALAPGGFICLGHSEAMSRVSSLFEIRKFPQAIVYQKPN
jgi:chemotaxis protein methyltransferase CheR